jgi:S1-C subfamily serine protease
MLPGDYPVVATGSEERYEGGRVDFLLAEREADLPPPGRMGMMLASEETGVTIAQVNPTSPAADAGFRPGDRVVSIAGERVQGMDDVRLALLDRSAGEEVRVEVARGGATANERREGRVITLM